MHLHLDFLNCRPAISCGTTVKCLNDPLSPILFNFVTMNVQAQFISHPQLSTDTNSMHADLIRCIGWGFVNTKRIVLL